MPFSMDEVRNVCSASYCSAPVFMMGSVLMSEGLRNWRRMVARSCPP